MIIQDNYQKTLLYAAVKHEAINQKIPGTSITYVVHLSNVAMEVLIAGANSLDFDTNFAVQVALLHDIIEDTNTSFDEIESNFSFEIAKAVQALTKNDDLAKEIKLYDSLERIKLQPKEVWAVKIADRITNLQKPPTHWSQEKVESYFFESQEIQKALTGGNAFLEKRLASKILEYKNYF